MKLLLALVLAAVLAPAALAHPQHGHKPPSWDPDGVAYTAEITVNRHDQDPARYGNHLYRNGPFVAHVNLDVSAVAKWEGIAAGTYEASIHCPKPITFHGAETGSRAAVSVSDATTFQLSVATHNRDGQEDETHRCWIRLVVRRSGEDDPVRAVLLPVDVKHRARTDH